MPRTPSQTAELIRLSMEKRNEEKITTRFQLSLKGIGILAGRDVVDQNYLMMLTSELIERGWCMFQVSHTSYSLISHKSASKFRKLSSDQILSTITEELE